MDGPRASISGRWPRLPGSVPPELAGIAALAAVLRLYRLGAESLWLDEAYSVTVVSTHSTPWLLFEHPTADPHPPLYYVVLKLWTYALGTSETVARFPSAAFGVGTVVATYWLARRLFEGDRRTAGVAALLVAVSPFHVWYAQEARMYALLAFLATLSTLLLVDLLDSYSRRRAAGYVAVTVLLGYTHVYGLFVVLAHGVYLAWGSLAGGPRTLGSARSFGVGGAVGLALSPWLVELATRLMGSGAGTGTSRATPGTTAGAGPDASGRPGGPVASSVPQNQAVPAWIPEPGPSLLVDHLVTYVPGAGLDNLAYPGPEWLPLVLAATACLPVLAALPPVDRWLRDRFRTDGDDPGATGDTARTRRRRAVAILALLVVVPIGVPYVVSAVADPILVPRYTLPASVGFYLLLARGLDTLPSISLQSESGPSSEPGSTRRRSLALGSLALVVVVAGMVAPLGTFYGADQHVQWTETAEYLGTAAGEDDVVLVVSESLVWRPVDYYFGKARAPVRWAAPNASLAAVRAHTRRHEDVFLVFAYTGPTTERRIRRRVAAAVEGDCDTPPATGDPSASGDGDASRGGNPGPNRTTTAGDCGDPPVETVHFRGISVYRYR